MRPSRLTVYLAGQTLLLAGFGLWMRAAARAAVPEDDPTTRALDRRLAEGKSAERELAEWAAAHHVSSVDEKQLPFLRWRNPGEQGQIDRLRSILRSALHYNLTTLVETGARRGGGDAEIRALEAVGELIQARDSTRSAVKVAHLQRALELVEQAKQAAPDNRQVREERLRIHTHLPAIFADYARVEEDLAFLSRARKRGDISSEEWKQIGEIAAPYLRARRTDLLPEFTLAPAREEDGGGK